MAANFHEPNRDDAIPMPSERSTGLVLAAAAAVAAYFLRKSPAAADLAVAIGLILAGLAVWTPEILRPLNIAWFKLALLLHRVVSPVIMALLYAAAIVPFGIVMQRFRDPLRRAPIVGPGSYWVTRSPPPSGASMKDQF